MLHRWAFARSLTILLFCLGCVVQVPQPVLHDAPRGELPAITASVLKVHHRSGALDVMRDFRLDGDSILEGMSDRYSPRREFLNTATVRIPVDSIALLESNDPTIGFSLGLAAMVLYTGASAFVAGVCLADPKSCFGSCPTFYLEPGLHGRPVAEGFSSSIARILEATDVDDLRAVRAAGTSVDLWMRNEARETHAIRHVRLHAVPVEQGEEVRRLAAGGYRIVRTLEAATACRARGGDCTRAVAPADTTAWRDLSESDDLASPDTMLLEFAPTGGEAALLLEARQTFISTFVLYQSMAWFGTTVGDWLANLERGDPIALRSLAAVDRAIGQIRVEQESADGSWRAIGVFAEAGPIATDAQLFPVTTLGAGPVRLRLISARGGWRIASAALATLAPTRAAVVLEPVRAVREAGSGGDALALLMDPGKHLIALPGDVTKLTFVVPADAPHYALFLVSRGYYYEWMRQEWLAEEDATLARVLLDDPRTALRLLAPGYKAREASFEQNFWASRFTAR